MKKVAIVFVLAVLLPSLVLAWLAIRSLRDQQYVLERQQSLLYQGVTDSLAQQIGTSLEQQQHEFGSRVEELLAHTSAQELAPRFDERLRTNWPAAKIGFVVTTDGKLLSPSAVNQPDAKAFRGDNGQFLTGNETAEVYWNYKQQQIPAIAANLAANSSYDAPVLKELPRKEEQSNSRLVPATSPSAGSEPQNKPMQTLGSVAGSANAPANLRDRAQNRASDTSTKMKVERDAPDVPGRENYQARSYDVDSLKKRNQIDQSAINNYSKVVESQTPSFRNVQPQQKAEVAQYRELKDKDATVPAPAQQMEISKIAPTEAEFQQLIGDANEGTLARFVNNKLNVLFWYRSPREQRYIFGAQLNLSQLAIELRDQVNAAVPYQSRLSRAASPEICLAVLDDTAKPVALSKSGFQANWKHPFVATEIGEALPHWEVAAYLLNPAALTQSARTIRLTLGLLIGLLLFAIAVGSWLIVSDLNRQLKLARQKTDFVSNVSHELKTPLTSIRMFSELLSEGRVTDKAKQRSYLNIITAETARLTRLINNVLDFSRMERGEKKYNIRDCDLVQLARESVESYRPHLENNGFKIETDFALSQLPVRGDCDALAQVIVNLLSNAEKYSNDHKEISVQVSRRDGPLLCAEFKVSDRGLGVPRGSEEKIFEKFYRAHDSLSSGIQGSGLGLTLARQIARAHGGDVVYESRDGGGSCFCLRLPLKFENTDSVKT